MITQFLIDELKIGEPSAIVELQVELWRQDPSPENYGKALQAWVDFETEKLRRTMLAPDRGQPSRLQVII